VNDGFTVSPDHIRAKASGLRQTADSFDEQTKAFVAKVNSLRQQPGNDMVSPLIWAAHDAVLGVLQNVVGSNIAALHTHANGLDVTAKVHELTDHANAQALNRVRDTLG
jgi:hypothetical protein